MKVIVSTSRVVSSAIGSGKPTLGSPSKFFAIRRMHSASCR
jgi:hypothetical protein